MIEAQAEQSLFGGIANFFYPDIDDASGVTDLGEAYRAPLISDVRTLMLSGSLDWNCPPYQAEEIRWGLSNATHIVVENAGHEQILPQPATQDAILRFLQGEEVRDVTVQAPPLRFVPIEGWDPTVTHPSVALAAQLLVTHEAEGVGAAIREYRALAARTGADLEREVNTFGYRLLQGGDVESAIAVFEANVEDNPDSWNVYDSLAEGVMESGDRDRAIELYEKSLQLNPRNTNGARMLEKLRGS
jgi:tetratricopeptide (TPR) repeat protein